eukprot:CAMPEP_0117693284 /NCGR_PEP_ID=MMETSP0804-20121206/26801_1 /TAXON_ID=1074897 /ORGANISM="Tetraselmis astigmatica, Strain CCMP880" /LENGTH=52 /DNA_ID=CAMNT_0005506833 /DNA_START=141 /DNA_END=296 /DNA_ORIENTATION=-
MYNNRKQVREDNSEVVRDLSSALVAVVKELLVLKDTLVFTGALPASVLAPLT